MNIDSPKHSNNLTPCTVSSKYFSGKPGMDDSLSEFQERKKSNTGPKYQENPSGSKTKSRRSTKRIRGQKDIRTALKPKKNELVSYAKDFEKICKQSGIDTDPEQLQLAIAISKSLHQTESRCEDNLPKPGSLSAQERTGKIRTTLLEYGFKVPEIKITTGKNKKLRSKKPYKLLLLTTAEKQQIISDKYSQVLFQNLNNSKLTDIVNQSNITKVHLYNIATGISYEYLKSNTIFYVDELIEKSPSTVGCLLRDWSEIPGRPLSPICDTSDFNFTDIECSQDELDIVLSGSLKHAQDIIKNWHCILLQEDSKSQHTSIIKEFQKKSDIATNMDVNTVEIVGDELLLQTIDLEVVEPLKVHMIRSYSPDIFDDEVSCILDKSKRNTDVAQEVSTNGPIKDNNDFMDLTECVNVKSQSILAIENTGINEKLIYQLSQGSNTTKRRSNDFMEITECVGVISQPVITNVDDNFDLTQNSGHDNSAKTIVEEINKCVPSEDVETMDLTQSSASNDSLPFVQISGRSKSLDDTIINDGANDKSIQLEDTIILNNDVYGETNQIKTLVIRDNKEPLTNDFVLESRDSNGKEFDVLYQECDLTRIQDAVNNEPTSSIAIESDDETGNLKSEKLFLLKNKDLDTNICSKMQEDVSISAKIRDNDRKSKTESFFEEFVHHHSDDDNGKHTENIICLDDTTGCKSASDVSKGSDNNIDLTQHSESTEEIVDIDKSPDILFNTSSLGKNGDVSIDYDEIFDDVIETCSSNSKNSNNSKVNVIKDKSGSKSNSDLISSSQDSEVFEISDKELNYSINKSKHEIVKTNFDLGGISFMDNLSNARSSKSSNFEYHVTVNDTTNDSFLPIVVLKGSNSEPAKKCDEYKLTTAVCNAEVSTPSIKPTNKYRSSSATPKNKEYIIKTDQVTPMSDYGSMATPERNRELDKYGLKSFKRKRAIQLLTHIYNQTHPVVESCSSDDLPSPSKRIKTDHKQHCVSPRKLTKSPKKNPGKSKSPERNTEGGNGDVANKEHDLYEVTTEVPDVKNIDCAEDDWVFQKREKAKVHSCRVPLHIAFHNYVSARRRLREAVLRYEPVNIDSIHKGLVASGHRYHPKDLLKFMDKKCITVKTADSGSKNNKKHY